MHNLIFISSILHLKDEEMRNFNFKSHILQEVAFSFWRWWLRL